MALENRTKTFFILSAVALAGCASSSRLPTRSGKPEVNIQRYSKKEVQNALASQMVEKGFQIKFTNDYQMVFSKKNKSLGATVLLGSALSPYPETRISYTTTDTEDGSVLIVGTVETVTNSGTAFESSTDVTLGKIAEQVQEQLNILRFNLKIKERTHEKTNEAKN